MEPATVHPEPWVAHRFRPDIEGMRALAVAAVVLFHADLLRVSGGYVGVDVFYVLSGFLITSLLVAELQRADRISLRSFYARRMRRLLPASVLVLCATAVLARLFIAPMAYVVTVADLSYAALYISNIHFAQRALDYLAATSPSPVLHYWSLAVEEQFYLVWPVVLIVAGRWWRRRGLVLAIAAITVASFVVCVVLTRTKQPWAFFLLPPRAWELSIGAGVALAGQRLARWPLRWLGVCSVAGIAALVWPMFAYDSGTLFPGWRAAVPVLGTAMLLAGGSNELGTAVGRFLSIRPLSLLGRWSYSLYLWHWPMLVIFMGDGRHTPSTLRRSVLVAVSVGLAALTHRYVEVPIRNAGTLARSPRRSMVLGGALTGCALFVALLAHAMPPALSTGQATVATASPLGLRYVPADLRPSLRSAPNDVPLTYHVGCHTNTQVTARCTFGDKRSSHVLVLFGDSHAAQWFPALEPIARAEHMQLRTLTFSACPSVTLHVVDPALHRDYYECTAWRQDAIATIAGLDHPTVIISNSRDYSVAGGRSADDLWSRALHQTLSGMPDADVIVIGDTPQPGFDPTTCLSAHLHDALACAPPRDEAASARHVAIEARVARENGARYIDPIRWICPATTCRVIDNNLLVYRDGGHITATYAAHLRAQLSDALALHGAR